MNSTHPCAGTEVSIALPTGKEKIQVLVVNGDVRDSQIWFAAETAEAALAALRLLPTGLAVSVFPTRKMTAAAGWDSGRTIFALTGKTGDEKQMERLLTAGITAGERLQGDPPTAAEKSKIQLERHEVINGADNLTEAGWLAAAARQVAHNQLATYARA